MTTLIELLFYYVTNVKLLIVDILLKSNMVLNKEKSRILTDLYENTSGSSGAYMGVVRLHKTAQKLNKDILYNDVRSDF